jgi:uncharacterized protein (DUF2141 family)
MRIRRGLVVAVVLAVVGLSAGARAQQQASAIRTEIKGFRSDSGQAGCLLFSSRDGFPSKPEKSLRAVFVAIRAKTATCEFASVPAGTYAIAVFHDENGNGKMDRNFVGAPAEGHGASRDAKPGFMSPPSFVDASFAYTGGVLTLQVPLHY